MLDDEDLEDPILGEDGFEVGSLVNLDFEDDFLGVEASGGGIVFEDLALGVAAGGGVACEGAAFGGAAFGVDSLAGAAFDNFVFEDDTGAFAGASFVPVFFGVATGFGSGARSMRDATGALVAGAMNCPLAI